MRQIMCNFRFFFFLIIIIFIIYILLPNNRKAYEKNPETVCYEHFNAIFCNFRSYYSLHGHFPVSVKINSKGESTSWRYTIAKMEIDSGKQIVTHYNWDLKEPWKDFHNNEEIAYLLFKCYSETNTSQQRKTCDTSYLMLTHGKQLLENLPNNAVIIVESADCGIHWMEPKDIDIETLRTAISPFGKGKLNSYHDGYVNVLRKNGRIVKISKELSKEKVFAILEGKE